MHKPVDPRTYDEIQIQATLITCQACGQRWYMTHPQPICQACRRAAPAAITIST